jgi:hypothetical protein
MAMERKFPRLSRQSAACFTGETGEAIFDGREREMAKQTRVTIETESLLVLKGRGSLRAWCPQCEAEGEMIPIEGVGVISNLELSALATWIEGEEVHHSRSAAGETLICLNSLLKLRPKIKPLNADSRISEKEKIRCPIFQ